MNTKLLITIITIIGLLLSLSACGKNSEDLPTYNDSTVPTLTEDVEIIETTSEKETVAIVTESAPVTTDPTIDYTFTTEHGVPTPAAIQGWFADYIDEPFEKTYVDEYYIQNIAPLTTGGTITVEEMDGIYLQTIFFMEYTDLEDMTKHAQDFMILWLGRNLTEQEAVAIEAAIYAAQLGANPVFVSADFPEGLFVCAICEPSFGLQLTIQ